jgi:hypothetical protein
METGIDRGSAVGGWALIVGAASFGLFWGLAPTSFGDAVSWVPSLAVHAVSVLSVAAGLMLLAGGIRRPPGAQVLAMTGTALTFVGSVAVFPLIPIGLGSVALGLIRAGYPRVGTRSLLAGSVALLGVCVVIYLQQDGRFFGEDMPPFRLGTKLAFQTTVILIAVGLAAAGLELRRRARAGRRS